MCKCVYGIYAYFGSKILALECYTVNWRVNKVY